MIFIRNIEKRIERLLTTVIDFFYPPFKRFMSLELFRYGCCGGLNLALEWVLYYVFYHFVFKAKVFDLGFIAFTPHIAAFVFKFPITFLTGFWMARHISFSGSSLRGRTQIVRYLLVTLANIGIGPIFWRSLSRMEANAYADGKMVAQYVLSYVRGHGLPDDAVISPRFVDGDTFPT